MYPYPPRIWTQSVVTFIAMSEAKSFAIEATLVRSGALASTLVAARYTRCLAASKLGLQLRRQPWAGLALEHERRDALVVGLGIRLGENDQRAGDAAAGDELLGSIDHVFVAVPLCFRLHRRGVRAAARLRKRVGGHLLA